MRTASFRGYVPKKTIEAIKIKSGTINYVGERNPHAEFGNSGITKQSKQWAAPHMGEINLIIRRSLNNFFA